MGNFHSSASRLASEECRPRDEGMDEPCNLRYARVARILENGLVEFARGRTFGLHALRHAYAYRRPRGSAAATCCVQSISIRPCLTLQERSAYGLIAWNRDVACPALSASEGRLARRGGSEWPTGEVQRPSFPSERQMDIDVWALPSACETDVASRYGRSHPRSLGLGPRGEVALERTRCETAPIGVWATRRSQPRAQCLGGPRRQGRVRRRALQEQSAKPRLAKSFVAMLLNPEGMQPV